MSARKFVCETCVRRLLPSVMSEAEMLIHRSEHPSHIFAADPFFEDEEIEFKEELKS